MKPISEERERERERSSLPKQQTCDANELVQTFLLPGLEPGSTDGFLEFICYSEGRLPEELLPQVKCPVLVAWGDKDPRDPIELGRACGNFDSVEDFIVLPDVGIFLRMRHHIL
uniref:Uncharacterized protein n=1 Tax=Davidia involucrata TaxID=16924 RepID=A0A5B7A7E0_DAVIN